MMNVNHSAQKNILRNIEVAQKIDISKKEESREGEGHCKSIEVAFQLLQPRDASTKSFQRSEGTFCLHV